jgi:hypothetical protein
MRGIRAIGSAFFVFSLLLTCSTRAEVTKDDLYLSYTSTVDELRKVGFRPRKDVDPWPMKIPINWGADPFDDENWQFQLNAWRSIDPFLTEYFKTKNASLLDEAVTYVDDWYDYNINRREENPYAWYDMATGIRAMRLAFLIEAARNGLYSPTPEQMAHLIELADEHAGQLQIEESIALNNHGLFQVAGLNLLCGVISDREICKTAQGFASSKFNEIMQAQFTEEGVHTENSPSYHFFVQNLLNKVGALRRLPGFNAMAKVEAVSPWLTFPDGTTAAVGDSAGKSKPLKEDPIEPACLDDGRCYAVGDFTKSGYAIVRSLPSAEQTSMLFVTGMAHATAHKHADELSFELFEFGRLIFVDSGKYGYNNDAMRRYVLSADAHNTVGIDGVEINPDDIEMSGTLLRSIEFRAGKFKIEGSLKRPWLFQQERQITFDPGRSLRIVDTVSSFWSRTFVSSLHLAPDLSPVLTGTGFKVEVGDHSVTAKLIDDDCKIIQVRGQKEPPLGWISTGYQKATPTTVVRALCPGTQRSITLEMSFEK